MARVEPQSLPPYGNGTLGAGIRSRIVENINGLAMHVLAAGEAGRPCVLLLHGFPELAYSWRKVMLPLAAAGYHVIAPDQRGYGRTTGWDDGYDGDLDAFRILNLVRDTLGLVAALGLRSVAAVVGHDFGSPVAANSALIRPDVFRSLALMSSPYAGPPSLPGSSSFVDPRNSPSRGLVFDELAKLDRPRKHYQRYYQTRGANDDMWRAPQGVHAFLRGYYHHKSADWKTNRPHPLGGFTADALAGMPTYYIMDFADDMAATVAKEMPSAAEIAACRWLSEAELAVYAGEFGRNRIPGRAKLVPLHGFAAPAYRTADLLRPHHRRAGHLHRGPQRLGRVPVPRRVRAHADRRRMHAMAWRAPDRGRGTLGSAGTARRGRAALAGLPETDRLSGTARRPHPLGHGKKEHAMPNDKEIEAKFWKALKSDMTLMLGLDGVEDGHARPMTAQIEGEHGPIWFFTSKDNAIVKKGAKGSRAIATFASKGHDIFATIHGAVSVDNDRATIDRLWNRYVAAWFEGGKDDPKLALLRLDAERAEIWVDASSLVAGIKLLFGADPKKEYRDKVAEVSLR